MEKNIGKKLANRINCQIWYKRYLKESMVSKSMVQICEGGSISACDRDDVSSHLMNYQLFSEILEYELILFRSSHFDYDMEKS